MGGGAWIVRFTCRVIIFCCLLGGLPFRIILTTPLSSGYPHDGLLLFAGAACIASNRFYGGSGGGGGALLATDQVPQHTLALTRCDAIS
jgi:hypothetical protein